MSTIEWTDETWNPTRGCQKVSPGCKNCYAMGFAYRFSGPGQPYEGLAQYKGGGPQWTGEFREVPDMLDKPLHWRKPRKVFVNSMSDLFGEGVSDEFIDAVFGVMAATPQHTYQILTKRPNRMRAWFRWVARHRVQLPFANVWIGVSCEDQQRANERIPRLRETPAALRFLSIEPLLGPIDLGDLHGIDWVITGAESGPGRRLCEPDWLRSLRDQCNRARVPFFLKQADLCPYCDGLGYQIVVRLGDIYGERDTCTMCDGSGQTGKVRKGCPELDGQQWAQMPEVTSR